MIGHLGERVSALLDGQLSGLEEERAWAHVHSCHTCRDLVEREGWVKTRLAGLSIDPAPPSCELRGDFKSALLAGMAGSVSACAPGDTFLVSHPHHDQRPRRMSLVALGGGAAGAAVMGVLALGAAPADAPTLDRRTPVTSVGQQSPVGFGFQQRRQSPLP